jgi:FMN-dependent NADH-azoreductase
MKILHITTSPRGADSVSYQMSQRVIDHLLARHPAARVIARDLSAEPLPHVDGQYACALGRSTGGVPQSQGLSSLAWSDLLIDELKQADCVVIGTRAPPRSRSNSRRRTSRSRRSRRCGRSSWYLWKAMIEPADEVLA